MTRTASQAKQRNSKSQKPRKKKSGDASAFPDFFYQTQTNVPFCFNLCYIVCNTEKITYSELFHLYSGTAEAEIKIYPIRSAKYSNAKLTLEISCPLFWEVSSKDSAYKKDDEKTMYVDITLPANGTYTKKVKLTTLAYSKPDLPDTAKSNDIKIASASGKVQDS